MVKIQSVATGSIAEEVGIRPGDRLRKINGQRVNDILDYRYLITDDLVELEIERDGEIIIYDIEKDTDDSLGIELEPLKIRMCGNDCPFCFVDQNPAGMRKSLYFRDEDYRLSFLAGHYVTLTNLSKRDLDKIVTQRLSPLYISVHAIRPEVRRFLLGIKHDDRLLEKMDFLTGHGIELHTQIVVCPNINDGEVLDETLRTLERYHPHVRTVALVPLGLTKHREGLTPLDPVTPEYARQLLPVADRYAQDYKQRLGIFFVYPSDEFYIMAGEPIPGRERYDTFEQLENGVGMVRTLLDDFAELEPRLPGRIDEPRHITLVTGVLASGILREHIVKRLNAIENLRVDLVVVKNRFYGETIRVTGLLTGQDIFAALHGRENGHRIYLPKNCVNEQQIFLDDWRLTEIEEKLQTPVRAIDNDFAEIFRDLDVWELAA